MGLVLVMVTVALVVGGGVAVAAVNLGTDGRDFLAGTNAADQLFGKGGTDFLAGKKQDHVLYGGDGYDAIHGGAVGDGPRWPRQARPPLRLRKSTAIRA